MLFRAACTQQQAVFEGNCIPRSRASAPWTKHNNNCNRTMRMDLSRVPYRALQGFLTRPVFRSIECHAIKGACVLGKMNSTLNDVWLKELACVWEKLQVQSRSPFLDSEQTRYAAERLLLLRSGCCSGCPFFAFASALSIWPLYRFDVFSIAFVSIFACSLRCEQQQRLDEQQRTPKVTKAEKLTSSQTEGRPNFQTMRSAIETTTPKHTHTHAQCFSIDFIGLLRNSALVVAYNESGQVFVVTLMWSAVHSCWCMTECVRASIRMIAYHMQLFNSIVASQTSSSSHHPLVLGWTLHALVEFCVCLLVRRWATRALGYSLYCFRNATLFEDSMHAMCAHRPRARAKLMQRKQEHFTSRCVFHCFRSRRVFCCTRLASENSKRRENLRRLTCPFSALAFTFCFPLLRSLALSRTVHPEGDRLRHGLRSTDLTV